MADLAAVGASGVVVVVDVGAAALVVGQVVASFVEEVVVAPLAAEANVARIHVARIQGLA